MTVPSGEVTVLMSWPRFVEAGRVNLMTAGTATTHRSRTVAIHRSGDAVPRAQAHHRSSPPWRDLAASASLLVRIRMLVPSDAACSSGASANRLAAASGPLDPQYQLLGGPFDYRGQGGVLLVVNQLALAITTLAVVVGAASLVVRFRRARGVERQQLRWVAWAA